MMCGRVWGRVWGMMCGRVCRRMGYLGKKLMIFAASVFILSIAVFYASRLAPGDPLVSYYGERAEKMSPDERAWAEEKLGLLAPLHVQYARWLGNALKGDFGISFKYKRGVLELIRDRLPNTLVLGGGGFILIFILSLLLGILCAWFEERWPDRLLCRIGTAASCIPEFWLALVLILIFAVWFGLLPSSGAYSAGGAAGIGDRAVHLVLPMAVVVSSHLWYYAYLIRNKLLEEVREDYVLLVESKGLGKKEILFRHCLHNVLPSYLSIMAVSVPHILGGTYVVETVFSYPGIGTLSYESARYQDYNLLMVLCIFSGILVILCNLVAQMLNERIDPRIRAEERAKSAEG